MRKLTLGEKFREWIGRLGWKLFIWGHWYGNEPAYQVARDREAAHEYREHLRFVYRWVSRLNGDKPHDRPEAEWKSYVATIVNYPSSPWQTGDWFED